MERPLTSPNLETLDRFSFQPERVDKPWGYELIWALTESYCGKLLFVRAGEQLSLQFHNVKDETVYLLSGNLIYRVWENDSPVDVKLQVGEAFRITPGTIHRPLSITRNESASPSRVISARPTTLATASLSDVFTPASMTASAAARYIAPVSM